MTDLILPIFLVFALLCLLLKPKYALCAFCVALFCFPRLATFSLASVDFTINRFIIIPLLINLIFRSQLLRYFKWNLFDTLVVVYGVCRLLALQQNVEFSIFFVREIGNYFMAMLMPYFAFRLVIRSRSDLVVFIKTILVCAVPLAVLGIYEWKTGTSPYDMLTGWYPRRVRSGYYRATGTFVIHICWGLYFACLVPFCLGMWKLNIWSKPKILVVLGFVFMGIISSMSSAPLFATVIGVSMLVCFPVRHFWRVLTIVFIFLCILMEFYSNRHFYEVPTRFAFSGRTARYRIELINEALDGGMSGHWIAGYGYVGVSPDSDNTNFHWEHKDLTNIYIGILARVGLLGLIPYLMMNVLYYRRLYQAAHCTRSSADHWLIWCFSSMMCSLNVAMLTVGALAQISIFLYMMMGICCNLPGIMSQRSAPVRKSREAPSNALETQTQELCPEVEND
jgi:hypothetical protein